MPQQSSAAKLSVAGEDGRKVVDAAIYDSLLEDQRQANVKLSIANQVPNFMNARSILRIE